MYPHAFKHAYLIHHIDILKRRKTNNIKNSKEAFDNVLHKNKNIKTKQNGIRKDRTSMVLLGENIKLFLINGKNTNDTTITKPIDYIKNFDQWNRKSKITKSKIPFPFFPPIISFPPIVIVGRILLWLLCWKKI